MSSCRLLAVVRLRETQTKGRWGWKDRPEQGDVPALRCGLGGSSVRFGEESRCEMELGGLCHV